MAINVQRFEAIVQITHSLCVFVYVSELGGLMSTTDGPVKSSDLQHMLSKNTHFCYCCEDMCWCNALANPQPTVNMKQTVTENVETTFSTGRMLCKWHMAIMYKSTPVYSISGPDQNLPLAPLALCVLRYSLDWSDTCSSLQWPRWRTDYLNLFHQRHI